MCVCTNTWPTCAGVALCDSVIEIVTSNRVPEHKMLLVANKEMSLRITCSVSVVHLLLTGPATTRVFLCV